VRWRLKKIMLGLDPLITRPRCLDHSKAGEDIMAFRVQSHFGLSRRPLLSE